MLDERYSKDIKNGKIDRSNFDANIRFLEGTGLLKNGIRILEVGCGVGRMTNHLTQNGYDVIGFDISRNMIKEGHTRYPNAIIFVASGGDIPFKDLSFDIVLSFDVLKYKEYHCSLHNYLSLKWRLLKNGFSINFYEIPVVNDFFKEKIEKQFGFLGLKALRIFNPDIFPYFLKTNFYLVGSAR